MAWTIDPVYRGCETVREYVLRWSGSNYAQRFDRKRDAQAYADANPNGPGPRTRLVYVDGRRTYVTD